jgi:glyoxylase-like metal-dependent hydrolase (beta-lactamase superfamily II)
MESRKFGIGTFDCVIVLDGTHTYHDPARVLAVSAPKDELTEVLWDFDIDLESWDAYVSPYPSLVIDTGKHKALVDVGAGQLDPTTGKLPANLRAAGVEPGEIDTVIITHAHPDHIGGVLEDDGQPTFTNARYVMWRREWEFWTSNPDLSSLRVPPVVAEHMRTCAENKLPSMREHLDLIDTETEILPGIHAIATPGHTPGHIALVLSSDGEDLLWTADTMLHPMHVERPEWYTGVDWSADQTLKSRRRILDLAATEGILTHAFHFPFPGLGHVVQEKDGWHWQPIEEPA